MKFSDVLLAILSLLGVLTLRILMVTVAWNYSIAVLLGVSYISFWQAFALLVLINALTYNPRTSLGGE